eukprot:TRINITY_DN8341_c0_g1_i1.p1 TRINITY_DN8341_c0_g1~~TRINITY_DN8341_c0_g1_i1.p1  ORF type:complete len:146 (-),score=13.16 TRINITY_DN8341_c0_g1_i1:973-1410(-)
MYTKRPASHPFFRSRTRIVSISKTWPGMRGDDEMAALLMAWQSSSKVCRVTALGRTFPAPLTPKITNDGSFRKAAETQAFYKPQFAAPTKFLPHSSSKSNPTYSLGRSLDVNSSSPASIQTSSPARWMAKWYADSTGNSFYSFSG